MKCNFVTVNKQNECFTIFSDIDKLHSNKYLYLLLIISYMLKALALFLFLDAIQKNITKRRAHEKMDVVDVIFQPFSGCGEKEIHEQITLPEGVAGVEWLQDDGRDYKFYLGKDGTVSYYSPS